jgi:hypothetical protein
MPSVVIADAFGGPEVLSVVQEPTAEPGPGQARIAVRAAGVNPVDYKAYSGAFGTDPARLPVPDEALDVSLELVADRARIATIAGSPAASRRASRFSAARRAQMRGRRSATPPGWSWPGSPRSGRCGSS